MGIFTRRPGSALDSTGLVTSTPAHANGGMLGRRRGVRHTGGGDDGLGSMTVWMWVTWGIAFVGWWVAFIAMCVGEAKLDAATGGPAMGTLWFAIIFQAAVIIFLTFFIAKSSLPVHRLQLCFILAILVVFAVNGVEYIYQGQARARAGLGSAGSLKAVGAGWLMLAIIDIIWLLWLSSEEDSFLHRTLSTSPVAALGGADGRPSSIAAAPRPSNVGGLSIHEDPYNTAGTTYPPAPQGMNGYQAAPVAPPAATYASPARSTQREREYTAASPGGPPGAISSGTTAGQPLVAPSDGQYRLRAQALYAYTASPDDPNEVSFAKGEILDIMDASGKWWQCRNQNGQVGICPSNYVQLLS
ncbi:hypothetical protein NliqN6_6523 [Naganishia liquefaciens]|uniref:SH3 domain-containing protein n=1 Tax=Naganishia liquefaciens TaxID=104408 RepID=A0A8H3TYR8_9TREE|nr:hypothetical protein NliqN6_6523 [Naganishia liquefaciens]